jgi:4-hydroxybenzoate polyprenyltransferase
MLIRPPVALVVHLFAAIGLAAVGAADALAPLFTTVLVVLAGWFVNAAALNDLADEEVDRINLASARGRPLVSGRATRTELWLVAVAAGVVALAVAAFEGGPVVIVVAAGLAVNAAYSLDPLRLSRRGAFGSITAAAVFVVVPYLVGVLSVEPDPSWRELALLPGLVVAFTGRILLKDFRDAAGDSLFGKWTFLLRHGRLATCRVSAACWIVGTAAVIAALPAVGSRPAVIVVGAACLLAALHGLVQLTTETDPVTEQVVIGAIAMAGRGLCIAVLAHLITTEAGWAAAPQVALLGTIGTVFVAAYVACLSARGRVTAISPY